VKKRVIYLLSALLLLGFSPIFAQDDDDDDDWEEIDWLDEIEDGLKKAKEAKKPLLVFFPCATGQCWQCSRTEGGLWEDEDILEYATRFICVEGDPEERDQRKLMKKLGSRVKKRSHTQVHFIDPIKEERLRKAFVRPGMTARQLRRKLKRALKEFKERMEEEEKQPEEKKE
jgi:hypothetical protein